MLYVIKNECSIQLFILFIYNYVSNATTVLLMTFLLLTIMAWYSQISTVGFLSNNFPLFNYCLSYCDDSVVFHGILMAIVLPQCHLKNQGFANV